MATAQHKALVVLSHKYPEKYRDLYLEELTIIFEQKDPCRYPRSRAQSRAKTKLSHIYSEEYRLLYEKAAASGYTRTHSKGKRSRDPWHSEIPV